MIDDRSLAVEIEQTQPMPLAGAFRCEPSELLALVGPSGAGKTSMLRILAGLMRPERCHVAVGGEVWCDTARGVFLPPQRRQVGLVFQNYALMPHLSALDNVALSLLHLPRGARVAQARHWLEHRGALDIAAVCRDSDPEYSCGFPGNGQHDSHVNQWVTDSRS
ncbi:ATP-binding cassette domain-containing protein [Burkholderia sp. LMG 13014]|uniref:ATP-binding cassette domain-containing protein n=1 Tax=Burkholderia sp. LMG 13014 TaxID=2709306 RepID=UPI001965C29F|nr:ATP-binding cassette domain-containing protein [Burkholderia sp. LMG 13014]